MSAEVIAPGKAPRERGWDRERERVDLRPALESLLSESFFRIIGYQTPLGHLYCSLKL